MVAAALGLDPYYLKGVAPTVAKRIRETVNIDPRIAKVIQFNQAGTGAGALLPAPGDRSAESE